MISKSEILEQAIETVDGRGRDYGPVKENFDRIARRWNAHLRGRYGDGAELDAIDVAAMMTDVKLARVAETPSHADSWLDIAGYAACGGEIASMERDRIDESWAEGGINRDPLPYWRNGVDDNSELLAKPKPEFTVEQSDTDAAETRVNDGWVRCPIGECPTDLQPGDWVRNRDGNEGKILAAEMWNPVTRERCYCVELAEFHHMPRWFRLKTITAYRRKTPV